MFCVKLTLLGSMITKKYKGAVIEAPASEEYFTKISVAVLQDQKTEWETEIEEVELLCRSSDRVYPWLYEARPLGGITFLQTAFPRQRGPPRQLLVTAPEAAHASSYDRPADGRRKHPHRTLRNRPPSMGSI